MDYSKLTNDELDNLILRKRDEWDDEDFSLPKEARKSYSTDPRYAMELLKEMTHGGVRHYGDKFWEAVANNGFVSVRADTPERAIAEAWLQWSENE